MLERSDVAWTGTCRTCLGNGRDPKKRTRKCPGCHGDGKAAVCQSCGEHMPCPGTRLDVMDQGSCDQTRRAETLLGVVVKPTRNVLYTDIGSLAIKKPGIGIQADDMVTASPLVRH